MKTKLLFTLLTCCVLALAAASSVQVPDRAKKYEVPEKYRDTVSKGLEYLVKNQHKDGHWEGDGGKHPVAMTALAGMALLMEGSTTEKGKYSANIRKAVDWLMDQSQAGRDGLIYSSHPSETDRYMYGHGLATQILAWASGNETDKNRLAKLEGILTRALKYIARARSSQGGWYRTSKFEGHDFDEIAATAIQIQALYTAFRLLSDFEACTDGQKYLEVSLEKYEKGVKPGPNRSRAAETAAALVCRSHPDVFLNDDVQDGLWTKWFAYCRAEIPLGRGVRFGRDELTHYYYAQAVYNYMLNHDRSVAWSDYRTAMFDHLQSSQTQDGSWPAGDGISVGPVYSTAVWCTVLQFDKRCHPLTRERAKFTF